MKARFERYVITLYFFSIGAVASALIAPKNEYFWRIFSYYWFPQITILLILLIINTNRILLHTVAIIMPCYLYLFYVWTHKSNDGAMGWLIYFYTIPGVAFGIIVVNKYIIIEKIKSSSVIIILTALSCFIGGFISFYILTKIA